MTMNRIMAKLRKKNKGQYRLLGLCVFLSVILVSSFAFMYFSNTVQSFLPEGGDTRKLSLLMMGVTLIGCTIFTIYGTGLFFRHKSREVGVMLALGERKKLLARCLVRELLPVIAVYALAGIATGLPFSFLIWKGFQTFVVNTVDMTYSLGFGGVAVSIIFALFLVLCIFAAGVKFMKKIDVMEILNQQRKTEMVREIKPWTGKVGIVFCVVGLFLAVAVPSVSARMFSVSMPSAWNATYGLCVVGLYLFMLNAVGHTKKNRDPEKYYKNIISVNLMRFTARQTTRNMCVATLLIFVMLISSFWGVMYYNSALAGGDKFPDDCSMHFPASEQQVKEADIQKLAEEHNVEITSYEEAEVAQLVITYKEKDLSDEGKYYDTERKKLASFVSASDFSRIASLNRGKVNVKSGEYKTVVNSDYKRSIWVGPDCLKKITNPVTGDAVTADYAGTERFGNMTSMSEPFVFILSDEEYEKMTWDLSDAQIEKMIFFSVKDVMSTYDFSEALQKEYINRATELSDHMAYYDAYEEQQAKDQGKEYGYTGSGNVSADNIHLMDDWKYAPFFRVMVKTNAMQMVSIFVLMSIYISIISLAAVGIMNYVRSVTIAEDNRVLFGDLKKLGADRYYKASVIYGQLRKVFFYPALAGCGMSAAFCLMLTYFNDMHVEAFEVKMLAMEAGMILVLIAFLYMVYGISLKKMIKITP
ncbi:MAG: ABC transporter permease [Clostridiales bacterium]|nr:ABC transporter permease [Clostridiales bacterium]